MRLLFHNAELRKLLGYQKDELEDFDTRRFWDDLDERRKSSLCFVTVAASS